MSSAVHSARVGLRSASESDAEAEAEALLPRATGDQPRDRSCMSCGRPFHSEGWHNRLCRQCQRRSEA